MSSRKLKHTGECEHMEQGVCKACSSPFLWPQPSARGISSCPATLFTEEEARAVKGVLFGK